MTQVVLIGIGAGVAAALLFLSPVGGTALALPLFLLSGLAIAIAGLGWTWVAAVVASAVAAVIVFLVLGPEAAAIFLLIFGAPVTWMARLVTLSRPHEPADPQAPLEWFPLGRILLHGAVMISVGMVLVGVIIGFNADALAPAMADTLAQWLGSSPDLGPGPSAADLEPFVRFNLAVLPFSATAIALVVTVFNLWLGAKVAAYSGRLARPRERLWTTTLPNEVVIAFPLAAALAFLPGPVGIIAGVVAGAFGAAVALVGLAVLHAVTLGASLRVLILVVAYVLLLLFGFPIVIFAALGITESIFHLRARRFSHAPPP